MRHTVPVLALLGLISCSGEDRPAARHIIDLSYPFSEQTVYWPTAEDFRLKVDAAGITDRGYYYAANSFSGAEHGGTHLDAPVHFAEGMPTVDRIPLERLVSSGALVDVSDQCAADRDYLVTVEDLTRWEERNSRIPEGAILLLRTGWGRYYPDRKQYLGTDLRGQAAISDLHFPGLAPEAARWLAANRSIGAIGLDTASIDRGQSQLFESHQILFKAGIPALENVANLDRLPPRGFEVIALPMMIQNGSGAPLRIIAMTHR